MQTGETVNQDAGTIGVTIYEIDVNKYIKPNVGGNELLNPSFSDQNLAVISSPGLSGTIQRLFDNENARIQFERMHEVPSLASDPRITGLGL